MEIKYDRFHELERNFNNLESLYNADLFRLIDKNQRGAFILYEQDDQNKLFEYDSEMHKAFPSRLLTIDLPLEIKYNLASISNDRQANNYLQLIYDEVNTMYEILAWNTNFHSYKFKQWGAALYHEKEKPGFMNEDLQRLSNPLTNFRLSYLQFIELILGLRDFIDEKIHPGKEFRSLQNLINNPPIRKTEIIPKLGVKDRNNFEDIFYPKYQKHYHLFFEALNEVRPAKPYITNNNEWTGTKSHALHYFHTLKHEGVIKGIYNPASVACYFRDYFGINETTFQKELSIDSSLRKEFTDAIKGVINDIRVAEQLQN